MEYVCLTTSQDTARTLNLSYNSAAEWKTDIPCEFGGLGVMPTPLHLLISALSSCMATCFYLRATELGLPGQGVRIESAVVEEELQVKKLVFNIHLPAALSSLEPEAEELARTCPIAQVICPNLPCEVNCSIMSESEAETCA